MDDEIKGEGNSVNYRYRMHDPRVGRFFAIDPLFAEYPFNSPYAFSENVLINAVELEGLEKDLLFYSDPSLIRANSGRTPEQLEEDRKAFNKGRTAGTITGGVVLLEIFVTRGMISMGLASGNFYQATLETDKAYAAKARGDDAAAEKHLIQAGELSKDMIFEGLGGSLGYGIGKVLQVAKRYEITGSKLVSTEMLAKHADSDFYGPPSGTFMAPTKEIDELLSQGLTREQIADKLGINNPDFLKGELVRIDIDNTMAKELNVRTPTGKEQGANEKFIPGGKTSGGVTERTVDQIPKNDKRVKVTIIEEKP